MLAGAALALMLAWLAVSAVGQLPGKLTTSLRRWDLAGLIPHWTFFAPRPGTIDFHLLYRDTLEDGSVTDWTEVPLYGDRRWWHFLWNPMRRSKKALFDLTVQLLREAMDFDAEVIQLSVPYLVLLTYVSGLPRLPATSTQFLLVISHGHQSPTEPEPMFVSAVHGL